MLQLNIAQKLFRGARIQSAAALLSRPFFNWTAALRSRLAGRCCRRRSIWRRNPASRMTNKQEAAEAGRVFILQIFYLS